MKTIQIKQVKINMKRIIGFTAALFMVIAIGAANGFAQNDMMKQTDTMTKQNNSMLGRKKPMIKKHRTTRSINRKNYRRLSKSKMMKKSTMK